ncbi:IS5 family transposase [Streptomyces rochei]|uniref:IS5 family transposase n=1 Tax=Streptomyces rochei TaxID=1928 RepID=UPI0037F6ECDF
MLAQAAGLERGRRLATAARDLAGRTERGGTSGLVPLRGRLLPRQGAKRGQHTGPSPVDRGRARFQASLDHRRTRHPARGAATGGNRNDVTQLLPLLDAIPPVRGRVGHPRRKPDSLFADRGYDHDIYRGQVRARGIVPAIARRGTLHGTGLGTYRWVVERTFAWLHGFRRLRIRWERRADIHEAFLKLACCLITYRQLGVWCRP